MTQEIEDILKFESLEAFKGKKAAFGCTANVNRQTTDKLLFSYSIITGKNV